jgi:hypothetical protein
MKVTIWKFQILVFYELSAVEERFKGFRKQKVRLVGEK